MSVRLPSKQIIIRLHSNLFHELCLFPRLQDFCIGDASDTSTFHDSKEGHNGNIFSQKVRRKQYLAYDGPITTNTGYRFHDQKAIAAILLHMIALSIATDRILILPAAFDAQRWLLTWQMLDVHSLSECKLIANL